jgi:hypothetical protein
MKILNHYFGIFEGSIMQVYKCENEGGSSLSYFTRSIYGMLHKISAYEFSQVECFTIKDTYIAITKPFDELTKLYHCVSQDGSKNIYTQEFSNGAVIKMDEKEFWKAVNP